LNGVVIIGAGQAGLQAALSLRDYGYTKRIRILGAEFHEPYHRPPLSKIYLSESGKDINLKIRNLEVFNKKNIEWLAGVTANKIHRTEKFVEGKDEQYPYERLIIATGGRPHRPELPGLGLKGVLVLRNIEDADQIRTQIVPNRKIVILGGGIIGLEVAATARAAGCQVTVVEGGQRVLERMTPPILSNFYEQQHRERGVTILLRTTIRQIIGKNRQVSAVELSDGVQIEADCVLIATGLVANDELAQKAELECKRGIVVNDHMVTNDPSINAVGDVSVQYRAETQSWLRVESVANAIWQAKVAAAYISKAAQPAIELPWFWSDQYDIKLQIAGLSTEGDAILTRGNINDKKFCLFLMRQGRVISVCAINNPGEFLVAKKIITNGTKILPANICDPSVSLNAHLNN
jgi:3-phenylpropionate/trans-cinnamate dioxygenase ferredoxin reductase subunit